MAFSRAFPSGSGVTMLRMSRSEVRAPTRHLTLRVSPDLVAELERLANREKRSRSSLVKEGISLVLARSKAKTATRDRWLLSRLWPLVTAIMSSDDSAEPSGHAPFLDAPAAAELLGVPAGWLRALPLRRPPRLDPNQPGRRGRAGHRQAARRVRGPLARRGPGRRSSDHDRAGRRADPGRSVHWPAAR